MMFYKFTLMVCLVLFSIQSRAAKVEVLKHPYPYRASLSINSDRHFSTLNEVDAVHQLVMSEDEIPFDSKAANLLFGEHKQEYINHFDDGIEGFNLPLADSFWLVGEKSGVYSRARDDLFLNTSYGDQIDRQLREGTVDTIHTFGTGRISRDQAMQSASWLLERFEHLPSVWVSHSFSETPSAIEVPLDAAPIIYKNQVKGAFLAISEVLEPHSKVIEEMGLAKLQNRLKRTPKPSAYPEGKTLIVAMVLLMPVVFLIAALILWKSRFRKSSYAIACWFVAALAVGTTIKSLEFQYNKGGDPTSDMYNLDIVRDLLGIKYYWFIVGHGGYKSFVENTLVLPESKIAGKDTFFIPVELEDGSSVFGFSRNFSGYGGMDSLRLFTQDELEKLEESEGFSIVYTHWGDRLPVGVFDIEGLEGLARLSNAYRDGRIWVAPTGRLLKYHHVSTFLDYRTSESDGQVQLDINGLQDPVYGQSALKYQDLAGLSFSVDTDEPVVVKWSNTLIPIERKTPVGSKVAIWQVPMDLPSSPAIGNTFAQSNQ